MLHAFAGEGQHGRAGMHGVEKAIGRQIGPALLIQAGNPADWARRNNGLEGVMRQTMAQMRFVEHAKAFRVIKEALSVSNVTYERLSTILEEKGTRQQKGLLPN